MDIKIKIGHVVYIKTTGQAVFVLSIDEAVGPHWYSELSGFMATVRRPTIDDKGFISYVIDTFCVEELESLEDKNKEQVKKLAAMKAELGIHDDGVITFKN